MATAATRSDPPPPEDAVAGPATITLTRTLTRDQLARRDRLVRAAEELAMKGGYAAVTMHDVADRAGVARATVYRYFTSKNHLLGAVSEDWIRRLSQEAAASDLPADPAAQLTALLCRIVEVSAENALLAEAIVQAVTAPDPARGGSSQNSFHTSVQGITGTAFGSARGPGADPAAQRRADDVETVLGHVLLSGLVSLTARGRSCEEVQELMRTAVRLVMPSHDGTD